MGYPCNVVPPCSKLVYNPHWLQIYNMYVYVYIYIHLVLIYNPINYRYIYIYTQSVYIYISTINIHKPKISWSSWWPQVTAKKSEHLRTSGLGLQGIEAKAALLQLGLPLPHAEPPFYHGTLWETYKKLWKIAIFNGKIHYKWLVMSK